MPKPQTEFDAVAFEEALQLRGWSGYELARRIEAAGGKVNSSLISKYRRGACRPSAENLQVIAECFGLSCDALLKRSSRFSHQQRLRLLLEEEYEAEIMRASRQILENRPPRMATWWLTRCKWYKAPRLFQLVPTRCWDYFELPVEQFALFREFWRSNRERRESYSRQFAQDEELMADMFWREQVLLAACDAIERRSATLSVHRMFGGTSDYTRGDQFQNASWARNRYLTNRDREETYALAAHGLQRFLREFPALQRFVIAES